MPPESTMARMSQTPFFNLFVKICGVLGERASPRLSEPGKRSAVAARCTACAWPHHLEDPAHLQRLRGEPGPEAGQEHAVCEDVVYAAARERGQDEGRHQVEWRRAEPCGRSAPRNRRVWERREQVPCKQSARRIRFVGWAGLPQCGRWPAHVRRRCAHPKRSSCRRCCRIHWPILRAWARI